MTTETATDDPTAFLADDLSADLPEGYDIKQYEGRSLRKIFGKGYNDVINDKEHFYIIIRGGKGSKKSKTVALMIIMRMMQYPLANTVCIRKSYNALKDSMFTDLLWAMDRLGVTDWWEVRRSPMQLELKHTHQVILFRGLDKAEKLGGLTVRHGYLCWMWIDEFFEITDEEEFLKAQMGLRGYMPPESGLWKQVICTFNPWSEHCWIKKRFFDEPHDNVLAKVTTYKCNEWLGEEDKKRYDELHETNPRMAKIICDGEWGIVEGLVYENWEIKAFDVEELKKDPNVHEAFGLDFGFSVSYTAFLGFLINPVSREIWIYEDSIYKLGMTNLDIAKAICELGYGDKRIVADCAQPKNIYELRAGIPEEYVDEWGDHHVRKWALPNIVASMKGNDSVLNGISRLQSFKIYVLPSNQNAIMELSSYYWEKNNEGEYTGKPHKDFDHCLVAGTMVLTDHGEAPIEDIQVGDMVLTHLGYRRVTASGITRPEPADIWRMTLSNGIVIEGTGDHPFPTNDGVRRMSDCKGSYVAVESAETPDEIKECSVLFNRLDTPKRVVLNHYRRDKVRDGWFHDVMLGKVEGFGLVRVESIEDTGRQEYVYDLTVEEAHDFFCNKVLSLNCLDSLRYGAEPYISKAKGKVAEAKGGTTPRSQVVIANNSDEQTTHRRSRRVASSSKVSRL